GRAPLADPARALRVQGAKTRVPGLHHPGPVRIPEKNQSLKAAKLQRTTLGEGQKRVKQRSIPRDTAAAIRLRDSSDSTFNSAFLRDTNREDPEYRSLNGRSTRSNSQVSRNCGCTESWCTERKKSASAAAAARRASCDMKPSAPMSMVFNPSRRAADSISAA